MTTRLASSVARLCKAMSIQPVADFYGLAWTTVKLVDVRHLERELGPVDLRGVEIIAMDEFAIQKGAAMPPWWSSRCAGACCGPAVVAGART